MEKDKSQGEKKMELAVKELDNVVKAMYRKVIRIEEELVNVKDSIKKSCVNEPFNKTLDYKTPPLSAKKVIPVVDNKSDGLKTEIYKCKQM